MAKAEIERKQGKARIQFASANAARKSPMRADIVRLVETQIFVDDVETLAAQLIKDLKLGELRHERGHIKQALDDAQDNARKAHALYVTCVREREAWEKRNSVIVAGMKAEANDALQEEKRKGERNKAITNADLDSMCALLFGDEWIAQERERRDYELAEEHMKKIAELWGARAYSLKAMSETA